MRKLMAACAVAAALTCVTAPNAHAQTIGFKVGPTFAKFSLDPKDDTNKTLTSFGGGGFVRFGAGPLSLQAEALAVTKGSKITDTSGEAKLKVTYIEIPLTAMFKLGNGPYLFAGPAVGFEASCKVSVESGGISGSADCDSGTDSFPRKKTDFSLTGGAGLQFPVGPGHVLVEGRYTHGLVNMNDDPNDDTKVRNTYFGVFAGYAINIGR